MAAYAQESTFVPRRIVVFLFIVLFHAFLSRRAKGILGRMEQTAVGFVNGAPESA